MPIALNRVEDVVIGGANGEDERDAFAESRPLVRAPVNRRGDNIFNDARLVFDDARLVAERRKRRDDACDQSKPASTRSAIGSACSARL